MTDAQQPPENEAEILHPEREMDIGDRHVVMREYTWIEAMRLELVAQPIVERLAALALAGDALSVETLAAAFGDFPEQMVQLIAAACDQPSDWVATRPDAEGAMLYLLYWATNADFFGVRLQRKIVLLQTQKASAAGPQNPPGQASATSSIS